MRYRLPTTPRRWRLQGIALAGVAGVAVASLAPSWLGPLPRCVAGYDVAVVLLLVYLWRFGMRTSASATRSRAAQQDPGRNVDLTLVLICIVVGLVAAIDILGIGLHTLTWAQHAAMYALGIAAVVLGWLLIHTSFVFRYAHLYYYDTDEDAQIDRGLTFPGTDSPTDSDFAYFSFVIGMTFQVSDVQVTDRGVRKVVLLHGLLSFAYNTAILALGINILSSLLH